jgi:hypothetical protein
VDEVTRILSPIERGDRQAAEQLLPLVSDEPRRLAKPRLGQEKPGQTLQATMNIGFFPMLGYQRGPRSD